MGDVIGVVPVAGFGSRLKPLTNLLPKELLPVGRHLIVERVISEMKSAGIVDLVFVVSPPKLAIFEAMLGQGDGLGVRIQYAVQNHMGGLADAVLCAQPYVPSDCKMLIALGDSFFSGGLDGSVVKRMLDTKADGAIATREVSLDFVSRYGIVALSDETSLISHIVEKPSPENAPSRNAVCARYLIDTSMFQIIRDSKPTDGSEHQLTGCLNDWIQAGHTIESIPLVNGEKRHDVGNFDTYYASVMELALEEATDRPQLERMLKEQLQ
jgi:UTP--glucose-1-phosphate uridylyltransferase